MHPAPAITPRAPCPPLPQSPSIAELIGEIVAQITAVIAVGLDERSNGGLRPRTKTCGGDLIAQLYALREVYLAEPGALDFNRVAREHGKRAIAAHYAAAARELGHPVAELTDAAARFSLRHKNLALDPRTRGSG